jgi:hypothetical protein
MEEITRIADKDVDSPKKDEEIDQSDRQQIQIFGDEVYNQIMACIVSTTQTEALMDELENQFTQMPNVSIMTLNNPYWLEAFIRATPKTKFNFVMEHTISLHVKRLRTNCLHSTL